MKEILKSALEALKAQPMLLSMMLLNVLFLAVIYGAVREERTALKGTLTLILERCLPKASGEAADAFKPVGAVR